MKPIITGTNITRSFTTGSVTTDVLRGIDIEIYEGEFVAIMGKSGAGKSTLMYQLSALDVPSSGEIVVANTTITAINEQQRTKFRRDTLGYVFQDYALVPELSAQENIMMPLLMRGMSKEEARAVAHNAMDAVDLPGKYTNLPSELSGGEQQRVSIARAVSGSPKILFADEPTANLDSISSQTVIDLLTSLHQSQGQTVVMVTHEPEYATDCDRIFFMEDGQVVDVKEKKKRTKKMARKK